VINKSLNLELPEEIININNLSNPRVGIRAGGPVQTNQMMLLHTSDQIPAQTLQICDGVFLGGDLQFLQDSISDEQGPEIQLCFGYAGWGAGQLEREFLDGSWFIYPASSRHIFHTPADKIWQSLLREMGGKYAGWDDGYYECNCPSGSHKAGHGALARVCICDGTDSQLINANGSCPPPPLKCDTPSCPVGQIANKPNALTCDYTCGCPEGLTQAGEKCVTPCADSTQVLLENGTCCSPVRSHPMRPTRIRLIWHSSPRQRSIMSSTT